MKLLIASLVLVSAVAAGAQTAPSTSTHSFDVAITYDAIGANTVGAATSFWLQGGSAQFDATLVKGFGLAADLTGAHRIGTSASGVSLDLLAVTFGPSYQRTLVNYGSGKSLSVFAHALGGFGKGFNSTFPATAGVQTSSSNSPAIKVGGGVDLKLSRRVGLRVLHADWLQTRLPNSANDRQNDLQLGTGIVFHL